MDILESLITDRKATCKDYFEALSKGQITQETCTQLLLNYDNQYIAFSDKICHNDMTKYYDLASQCLEVYSKPKPFMESLGSVAESFVKGAEILQQQQTSVSGSKNSTQPAN